MTTRVVLPYPVVPGQDPEKIAKRFKAEPDAYREDRAASGVVLERAYLQHTEMGDFVVAYIESEKSFMETMGAVANPTTEIGRWFVEQVKEVHGIDVTQPPEQLPELIAQWTDESATQRGQGFAFCAPVLPDQLDYGREWAKRTFSSEGMTRTRRELGERLEIVWIAHTQQGPISAIYLEGSDPDRANREFSRSADPFNVEFRENLSRIYPPFIDFSEPVSGVTEIFDSEKIGGIDLTGRARQASQAPTSG